MATKPILLDETGQAILNKLDDVIIATPIVDNLTTADPGKALSAKQGKILNDGMIHYNSEPFDTTLPINAAQLNGHPDTYFVAKSEAVIRSDSTIGTAPQINADQLNGHSDNYFATAESVTSLSGKIFYAYIVSSLSIQDSTWITDPFDLPTPSVLSRVSFIFDNDSQGYYGFIQKNQIGQIRIRTINGSGTVVAVGDRINITGIVA